MKKIIRFVICEGKNAKTEENFLLGYQNDRTFIKEVNHSNSKIIDYLKSNENKIIFKLECIDYKKLELLLDAQPCQSYLIIYIDNDRLEAFEFVKNVVENKGIKDNLDEAKAAILVYPSEGKSFEELLSFFFKNPKSVYKDSNLNNLKEKLGQNFKSDLKIYDKTIKKGSKEVFSENMKTYANRKIFNLLKFKI